MNSHASGINAGVLSFILYCSLTRFLSTGRKRVVVAIFDITSVTDATMAETRKAITG